VIRPLAVSAYCSINNCIGTNTACVVTHATGDHAQDPVWTSMAPVEIEIFRNQYQRGGGNNSLFSNGLWNVAGNYWGQQYAVSAPMNGCSTAVASNALTVTCANTFTAGVPPNNGPLVTFRGLTGAAWLNGATIIPATMANSGWTASLGARSMNPHLSHADYTALAETGGKAYGGFYYDDNISWNIAANAPSPNPYNIWNAGANHAGTVQPYAYST
jgi:hypothetical protein